MQEGVAVCDFCKETIVLSEEQYVHRTQVDGSKLFWHNAEQGVKKCWFKRLITQFAFPDEEEKYPYG